VSFARPWIIHRYESLASTMDEAASLARAGASERTAVISAEQTSGRGRGGRAWQSARGVALYITLILRPEVPADRLSALSLVAAVAVCEAIEHVTGAQPRLKWPNDVWLGNDPTGQKVAGILLASSLSGRSVDYALVGIGLNTGVVDVPLPEGATSLLKVTGRQFSPDHLLEPLLDAVDRGYLDYIRCEGRPSLDPWRRRAVMLGELVSVIDGDRVLRGLFIDVDPDGALLLADADGQTRRVMAGDLGRGPRR
jgi:BirA family biotin operon repressor/biotin-[acetyl-CoA-carboxylase] ligase